MTAATTATTLQPRDALDPIAQPAPGDSPIYEAVARDLAPKRGRDARGRFVKAGRS